MPKITPVFRATVASGFGLLILLIVTTVISLQPQARAAHAACAPPVQGLAFEDMARRSISTFARRPVTTLAISGAESGATSNVHGFVDIASGESYVLDQRAVVIRYSAAGTPPRASGGWPLGRNALASSATSFARVHLPDFDLGSSRMSVAFPAPSGQDGPAGATARVTLTEYWESIPTPNVVELEIDRMTGKVLSMRRDCGDLPDDDTPLLTADEARAKVAKALAVADPVAKAELRVWRDPKSRIPYLVWEVRLTGRSGGSKLEGHGVVDARDGKLLECDARHG